MQIQQQHMPRVTQMIQSVCVRQISDSDAERMVHEAISSYERCLSLAVEIPHTWVAEDVVRPNFIELPLDWFEDTY
jgi:hypothetical protein